MNSEERLIHHFAERLGCDEGAFRQKRALVLGCAARDSAESGVRAAPAWIFQRGRAILVSVVPPLAKTFRDHYADTLSGVDAVERSVLDAILHDLAPFFGTARPIQRTWYYAEPGFAHEPQIEIRPLLSRDAADVEAIAPGSWPDLARWAAIGRADGVALDGRIVGFASLRGEGRHALEIDCATHPDYRGIGLGRELLAHACTKAIAADRVPALAAPHDCPPAGHLAKRLGLAVFAHDVLFLA